jgi:tetratricopeptide (TPR) repeat protein
MGRCLRFAAQSGPAWRSFMRATTIYRERGDGASMARAALEASASAILPPREGLVALAEEALGMLGESDLHLRARLLLMRAGDHFDDASKAAAGEAKRILGELDDPALLGELVYRQAQEAIYEQRIDEAVSLFRRAHALLDQEGERQRAGHALDWVGTWILFEGKLDEGIAVTSDALAYARKFHLRPPELWCLAVLLAAALVRCDFTKFDSLLNEAAGSSEAAEDRTFLDVVTAARAEMSGDTEQALKLAPSPGTPVGAGLLAHLLGSLARMRFNSGQEHQAGGYLEEWNRELGPILSVPIGHRLYAIAELDECLPAFGDESLVRRVYEELAAWRTLRYGPPDGRGLDHIRGALALRLERIDEAEQWFRIGLDWARRERCPVEEGRCLQGLAEIASRQGRPADSAAMLGQAIALFEAHGARLFLNRATASREGLSASPPV